MHYALTLDHICKSFGSVRAVDGLSLEVPTGCVYGFLGPNGAGKTTTIRMIMSILYPDTGSLTVLGHPNPEAVKHRLGYLPEEKGLYKKMRAGEILAYFGKLKGMDARTANAAARTLLTEWDLGDYVNKTCETLSKGMSQKVQILGTLIHGPDLVILDEPFSGLDPVNVEVVRELILSLKRDGKSVIFSTHVMEQAEQICDFLVLIDRGKAVLNGSLSAVKSRGGKGIIVDYDGDGTVFRQLPGVTRVNDAGKHAEVLLADGADPQELLARLVGKIAIRRFDTREPSLHEIFVRTVGRSADA